MDVASWIAWKTRRGGVVSSHLFISSCVSCHFYDYDDDDDDDGDDDDDYYYYYYDDGDDDDDHRLSMTL